MPVKNSNMPTVDWVPLQTPGALGKHHGIIDNLPQVSSFIPSPRNPPALQHSSPTCCTPPSALPQPAPHPDTTTSLRLASGTSLCHSRAPQPPPLPLLAATTASHPAPGTGRINFTLSLSSVPYTGP